MMGIDTSPILHVFLLPTYAHALSSTLTSGDLFSKSHYSFLSFAGVLVGEKMAFACRLALGEVQCPCRKT